MPLTQPILNSLGERSLSSPNSHLVQGTASLHLEAHVGALAVDSSPIANASTAFRITQEDGRAALDALLK